MAGFTLSGRFSTAATGAIAEQLPAGRSIVPYKKALVEIGFALSDTASRVQSTFLAIGSLNGESLLVDPNAEIAAQATNPRYPDDYLSYAVMSKEGGVVSLSLVARVTTAGAAGSTCYWVIRVTELP